MDTLEKWWIRLYWLLLFGGAYIAGEFVTGGKGLHYMLFVACFMSIIWLSSRGVWIEEWSRQRRLAKKSNQFKSKEKQMPKKFFVIFVAIFAMTAIANAQAFTPNEKGEVSAVDHNVRSLMEQADKVVVETAQNRLEADKKLASAMSRLKEAVSNHSARTITILSAKSGLISAVVNATVARRPVSGAMHKAAMAYFDNVNAIVKAGHKLAPDSYGDWQEKVLPIAHAKLPPEYKDLMEKANEAQEAATKREEAEFRRFQSEFAEIQKRDRELRERIPK